MCAGARGFPGHDRDTRLGPRGLPPAFAATPGGGREPGRRPATGESRRRGSRLAGSAGRDRGKLGSRERGTRAIPALWMIGHRRLHLDPDIASPTPGNPAAEPQLLSDCGNQDTEIDVFVDRGGHLQFKPQVAVELLAQLEKPPALRDLHDDHPAVIRAPSPGASRSPQGRALGRGRRWRVRLPLLAKLPQCACNRPADAILIDRTLGAEQLDERICETVVFSHGSHRCGRSPFIGAFRRDPK